MKFTPKSVLSAASLMIGGFIGASALVAFAASGTWTSAPPNPPQNNVPAPINVGGGTPLINLPDIQEKTDSMIIDGGLSVLGNLQVFNGASTTPGAVLVNDGSGVATWSEVNPTTKSPTYVGTAQDLPASNNQATTSGIINLPSYTSDFTVLVNATYFVCDDRPVTLLADGITIGHYTGANNDTSGCDQNTISGVTTLSPGSHTFELSSDNGNGILGESHFSWIAGTDIGITDNTIVPLASVVVNTDEQVVIHIKGTSVTATNWTRNGGSIQSHSFLDTNNGLPTDGKVLKIDNFSSNNGSAYVLDPCPANYTPTSNPGYVLSNAACIYQQPTAANGYEAIVAIWDGQSGSHQWKFGLDYK